ncbi:Hsp20/alpha crystallin family protein [Hoyosella rhizosphaerae]|uniref:Heat-shock protein Hsp20 n=1 Tax=Hoyosella rhizosphaerae TaxID=1755582 RepID=A0A916TYG4_9ACTN|nr:Hsp20/alpha crystallin family protein [Hoyosella rhizosphaerae]MBN4927268.1 Hsp20/alpha crystallin family protein [Hoyosella rhizosphaerae]GGC52607.1 heat-shock protein Hsp20 [Hoyosella rhizosphaerae]
MGVPVRRHNTTPTWGRWDPLRDFEEVYDRLGRWFGTATPDGSTTWVPSCDIEESDSEYKIDADLPGVKKDDVSVEFHDGVLTISGEVNEKEHTGVVHRRTRRTGRFNYQLSLPGEIDTDAVTAHLADGVLTVTLPKSDKHSTVQKIAITD